ncbi:MAG: diacylglycerol kinase family lipid kinase [Actinomycetota bacterium]|nr:diacylglycerol kinase family lipid kinase [Actinomycetota bacterium]
MRALLVVNPKASTTSARARDVLAHALASEVKLDLVETNHRNHATELATQAVHDGLDIVVALGGDGTVNEVVNGLLHDGPQPGLPALAVVPAGRTNVFARALGLPNSPVEATGVLLQALLEDRRRTIGLGRADDRWFTFNAGLGVDAGAVRRVEKARAKGRTATQPLYIRSALKEFYFGTQRQSELTLTRPGAEPIELALALVCNADPWTYLAERPVRPCPDASFDTGLDVMGLTGTNTFATLRTLAQILAKDGHPHGKRVVNLHDVPELTLTAASPLPFQVDGDLIGDRESVHLMSVPSALDVMV